MIKEEVKIANRNTSSGLRYRRWAITLNNYTQLEYDTFVTWVKEKKIKYIIGKEGTITPHLQIYIESNNAIRFETLKKINNRFHLERARLDKKKNFRYCSKEGNFITNIIINENIKEKILKKYYNNVTWKKWQEKILNIIDEEPDQRKIYWITDKIGNTGKSFICKYIKCKYEGVIIGEGKSNDIFYQISKKIDEDIEPKIILVDVPRSNLMFVNYSGIEKIKNGLIYSGKYEGNDCIFEIPHVFIFANENPIKKRFSNDRWEIIEI